MNRSDDASKSSSLSSNEQEAQLDFPSGSDFSSLPHSATPEQAFALSLRLIAQRFHDPRAERERLKKQILVPFELKD